MRTVVTAVVAIACDHENWSQPLVVEGADVVVPTHVVRACSLQQWAQPCNELGSWAMGSTTPHREAVHPGKNSEKKVAHQWKQQTVT